MNEPPLVHCVALDDKENVLPTPFEKIFQESLVKYGIICLGLYRLMNMNTTDQHDTKRFVITFPPKDFIVLECDLVYPFKLIISFRKMVSHDF